MSGAIQSLLNQLNQEGLGFSDISKIKLSGGVVANLTYLGASVFFVFAVAFWKLNNDFLIGLCLLLAIAFAYWLITEIFKFAKEHPDQAMLGGAEFLAVRQQQIASKDIPNPKDITPVENPFEEQPAFISKPQARKKNKQ